MFDMGLAGLKDREAEKSSGGRSSAGSDSGDPHGR